MQEKWKPHTAGLKAKVAGTLARTRTPAALASGYTFRPRRNKSAPCEGDEIAQ